MCVTSIQLAMQCNLLVVVTVHILHGSRTRRCRLYIAPLCVEVLVLTGWIVVS